VENRKNSGRIAVHVCVYHAPIEKEREIGEDHKVLKGVGKSGCNAKGLTITRGCKSWEEGSRRREEREEIFV